MSDSDNTKDWDELEALRASLREHMAEIKRLNECLTWEQHRAEHVGTHGPGCAMWGPKHYECLLRAYNAMKERISQESRQVEPVAWLQIGVGDHEGTVIATTTKPKTWNPAWWRFEPLYTAPPKREPLTEEKISAIDWKSGETLHDFARAIERAHGIGGEE